MVKQASRKQLIQKGKWLYRLQGVINFYQWRPIKSADSKDRQEVFVETDYGRVRTLWYGFENKATAPIYFDLHGGGFILGTADMDEALNLAFTKQVGCKVISIEYAKAPEFPFPVAIHQVYAVIEQVIQHAGEKGIDIDRMAIGGHSAGGNLSTVICMKAKADGKFQFVCQLLDYPVLDMATSPLQKPHPKGSLPPQMAMIFDACYVDPAQARLPYVSPVYASRDELRGLPPALILLAGRDTLHDEGMKYGQLLNSAGVAAECIEYPNALHGFTLQPSKDTTDAVGKMTLFLRKYLL